MMPFMFDLKTAFLLNFDHSMETMVYIATINEIDMLDGLY
jgi:hypothetical protein